MTIFIKQNVFWFQVPVNDTKHMHVLNRVDEFGCVEPGDLKFETAGFLEVSQQVPVRGASENEIYCGMLRMNSKQTDQMTARETRSPRGTHSHSDSMSWKVQ